MRLAYRETPAVGAGVLWIHGYTLDSSIWAPLWARLPGWTHVGVDLPDHGASPPLDPGADLVAVARSIADAALARDVRHVIGLSFGSMAALEVVAQRSGAFASLVLAAPALGGGPQDAHAQTRNLELRRLYQERGPGPWLRELWMRWPPDIFKAAARNDPLFATLRATVDRHQWRELGDGSMQRLATHPQRVATLHGIGAATLLVVGEEDMEAFKRSAELIRRAIPVCRRVYLRGRGHLSLLEAPDEVAPLLDAHLRAA